jgi:DNA-binding response OmpR family regulator
VLTAYKNSDYEKQAKELGADAYFTKPVNHIELLEAIENTTSK